MGWARRVMALGLVGTSLLVVGCSDSRYRWENSEVPEENWSRDRSHCRSHAATEVSRETGYDDALTYNPETARTSTYDSQMRVHRSSKREKTLYEDCLRARGYRKVRTRAEEGQP